MQAKPELAFLETWTYLIVNREHLVRLAGISLALGAVCACVSHVFIVV